MVLPNTLITLLLPLLSSAATVTYDWNITRLYTNPDGQYNRPSMGINNQWPLPLVNVTKGDRIIIKVHNQLGNESTSLHFHGFYQNGTNSMDGPVGVTQCGIPPGSSFTYNFTADQVGTYWYHSHQRGQYPDGLRGPVIINDPDNPFTEQYDDEMVWTLSDWYHDEMQPLLKSFISVENPTGAEPVPDAALINDSQNVTFPVQPGKTYLIHLVNMGAFAGQYFWVEGHSFRVVEVDGVWTEPTETDQLYITVAQRYSILLTTKSTTDANFAIVGSMDTDLFDTIPETLNPNATAFLQYSPSSPLPSPTPLDSFNPFDDFTLVPYDREPLLPEPDQTVTLNMKMDNLGDGANYAFFNDQTYVAPKIPTLYTAMSAPQDLVMDAAIYGSATNSFVLGHNEVVELRLVNMDSGKHPFHLHGHAFQVITRADDSAAISDTDPSGYTYNFSPEQNGSYPAFPMRRDTLLVRPESYFAIRFQSDNPGIWLFHCHIEWHVDSGLIATIVEAPLQLQQSQSIPEGHLETCREGGIAIEGNAAGNNQSWTDLQGEGLPPAPLPEGFEPRGIVALTFSILSALLGIGVVGWYGSLPIGSSDVANAAAMVGEMR